MNDDADMTIPLFFTWNIRRQSEVAAKSQAEQFPLQLCALAQPICIMCSREWGCAALISTTFHRQKAFSTGNPRKSCEQ
jgi:hypothetical protein